MVCGCGRRANHVASPINTIILRTTDPPFQIVDIADRAMTLQLSRERDAREREKAEPFSFEVPVTLAGFTYSAVYRVSKRASPLILHGDPRATTCTVFYLAHIFTWSSSYGESFCWGIARNILQVDTNFANC